jgi:hypothetical protein
MALLRRVVLRFVSCFRSSRAEADLAREIDAHLKLLEATFAAQGMSATDAASSPNARLEASSRPRSISTTSGRFDG